MGTLKLTGKAAAALCLVCLIPILFVIMLPCIVFNGVENTRYSVDSEVPIMNDETVIENNARQISEEITAVLRSALDETKAKIHNDFLRSDADNYEIENPYDSDLTYNANVIVSQYCASKDKDFQSISIEDLSQILSENSHKMYSYTVTEETRDITTVDPETGEETVSTENWLIYSVKYNGEVYFADNIFALTDEQKILADNYVQNLSLFLNDGMLQHLPEWDGAGIPSLGNVRFTDGITEVVYYNQLDERYASKPFGTDHIGGYGCGPTAMAIVVSSLTDDTVDPVKMAKWAYDNGYWCKSSGSYHALIPAAAKNWGLPVEGCTAAEPQRIIDALSSGKLIVALMLEGHFTTGGHFIVLRGVKDGKILVADPASYTRSEQSWDLSIILDEAHHRAAAGGPFWIIG